MIFLHSIWCFGHRRNRFSIWSAASGLWYFSTLFDVLVIGETDSPSDLLPVDYDISPLYLSAASGWYPSAVIWCFGHRRNRFSFWSAASGLWYFSTLFDVLVIGETDSPSDLLPVDYDISPLYLMFWS